jgi:hypothetical protein
MIPLSTIRTLALGLVVPLALACMSGSEGSDALTNLSATEVAKLPAWNQERVTTIATELAPAINEVYVSVNQSKTGAQVGSGQANAYRRLKDRVRVARTEAKYLATQLQDGKDREETAFTYARLMSLVRDARVDGRKMFIEKPTLDKIAVAGDLLRQLSPYYDPQANAGAAEAE